MKTAFILLSILFLASCNPIQETGEIEKLIATRDSLRVEYKNLGKSIKQVEEQIAKLDTGKHFMLITISTLNPQPFEHYFDARGNVEADKNTSIYSEVPGTIETVKVVDGESVQKGDVLILLDTELIKKQMKEIETQLELAQMLFQKQKNLYDQNVGSEVQFLEAKNRKESLENTWATLKSQMEKSIIRAPFTGVVEEVIAKVGGNANPGFPLVHMVNLDKIYISADISERMVGKIKKGTYVDVKFNALDIQIPSKIRYAGNVINENNRTFSIKLDLPNTPDKLLKPNMVPILKIKDYSNENAIVVNSSNIQQDSKGDNFVYTAENVENGTYKVSKKYIKPGLSYLGKTEIIAGLKVGEILVEKGARNIKDGQIVKVAKGE